MTRFPIPTTAFIIPASQWRLSMAHVLHEAAKVKLQISLFPIQNLEFADDMDGIDWEGGSTGTAFCDGTAPFLRLK